MARDVIEEIKKAKQGKDYQNEKQGLIKRLIEKIKKWYHGYEKSSSLNSRRTKYA